MQHPSSLSWTRRVKLGLALAVPGLIGPLSAAWASDIGDCRALRNDVLRLACYDREAGAQAPTAAPLAPTERGVEEAVRVPSGTVAGAPTLRAGDVSALSAAWELDSAAKRGTFNLLPYKLNYLLGANYSSNPNTQPSSPAPDHTVQAPLSLQRFEAKYQLSLKVKVLEDVFGDNGDVWLAYTQQSYWQLYNTRQSSPFRSTDYEPEAIFSLRTNLSLGGVRWRLLNLGIVHQSNGNGLPQSRSWNRVYAQFGFERGDWSLLLRPWYRLPENAANDDNPDIRKFLGSGDARLTYAHAGSVYSVLGRYAGSGRGALQLDWAFPISKALKGYVQATTGYGASLIDYNHAQTTVGVGILILPWW